MPPVAPGDVLAVRTPSSIFGALIRFGAALRGEPHHVDHVVIVHHRDDAGTLWGVEGRPGGVGWVDVAGYDNRWLLSNAVQEKTDAQREQICALAKELLGTPYDWSAIVRDAMIASGVGALWRSTDFGDRPPGHVVCSSLAAWIYRQMGLAEPSVPVRWTTPGDWAAFIQTLPRARHAKER